MSEWERVRPWLEAALEYSYGTHSIEDVKAAIDNNQMFLITHPQCAMVFEIIIYPRMKVLHGFACGGDLQAIKSFDAQLTALARDLGCERITVAGRYGWARALRDIGFEPVSTIVSKEVH